jgi:hypothetical protein
VTLPKSQYRETVTFNPVFCSSNQGFITMLFNPLQVGSLTLPNRILLAPLTRKGYTDYPTLQVA